MWLINETGTHTVHSPTDAHLLKLWLQFTLKLDGSYMFRSTTIIRQIEIEPGWSYIDIKTFSDVTSYFVMRWCGSMSQYGVCIVCCAERDEVSLCTAHNTHAILGHAATPPSYILILLASCHQTCMTYTIAVCTVKNSRWWSEELPETCRVSFQNKFENLVHLVGFIIRNKK
jgi:hypothetical protein